MTFADYYFGTFIRPRRTFRALAEDPRALRFGVGALSVAVVGYTMVYVFLVFGHGRPTVFHPWLAIDPEVYYRYDLFLLAPSVIMAWLVAGGLVQLGARVLGGTGSFEQTLAALGFGIGVASWTLMLHDLVTAFLGAVGVMNQRAYEDAMSSPTIWRTLLWIQMGLYLVAFCALFAIGTGASHRLGRARSAILGVLGFFAYQLVFVIFNR